MPALSRTPRRKAVKSRHPRKKRFCPEGGGACFCAWVGEGGAALQSQSCEGGWKPRLCRRVSLLATCYWPLFRPLFRPLSRPLSQPLFRSPLGACPVQQDQPRSGRRAAPTERETKTHKGRALEMDEVCMPEKRDRVVAEMHSERKLLAGLPEPQTIF